MTRIAVVGLGYVGLPVALAFGEHYPGTVGFDVDPCRVSELRAGNDHNGEATPEALRRTTVQFTTSARDMAEADVFVVCVPTPIHPDKRPDLDPLRRASETVGAVMRPGAIIVYESTVHPGVTEEFCGPVLSSASGLVQGRDFRLGYSPERINLGDRKRTLETIVKVVAGEDAATTAKLAALYGSIVTAGVHVAPSIKVAETAKVLENTQRDLNIALMNELAIICDLIGVRTRDVIDAAATKWNFLPFSPGLVGGHCVGVDPFYLTAKAEALGYHPEVILAGRRINDSMGVRIAQRVIRFLAEAPRPLNAARVGILGVTFKEDVSDIRNSRVPDIVAELARFGVGVLVHDPLAPAEAVSDEYGITLAASKDLADVDALILAVPHTSFRSDPAALFGRLRPGGVLIDVRSVVPPDAVPDGMRYWSL